MNQLNRAPVRNMATTYQSYIPQEQHQQVQHQQAQHQQPKFEQEQALCQAQPQQVYPPLEQPQQTQFLQHQRTQFEQGQNQAQAQQTYRPLEQHQPVQYVHPQAQQTYLHSEKQQQAQAFQTQMQQAVVEQQGQEYAQVQSIYNSQQQLQQVQYQPVQPTHQPQYHAPESSQYQLYLQPQQNVASFSPPPPPPPPPAYTPVDPSRYATAGGGGYHPATSFQGLSPALPQRPSSVVASPAPSIQGTGAYLPPPQEQQKAESKTNVGLQILKNLGKEIGSVSKQTYKQAMREIATYTPQPALQASNATSQPGLTTSSCPRSQQDGTDAQSTPNSETPRILRKPIGQQVSELGSRAITAAKSEKGKTVLYSAASLLNFVSDAADPTEPEALALKMVNAAVQSGVKKSKAKQIARAAEADTSAEPTARAVENEVETNVGNPLANMTSEQIAMIVALATQLQQSQGQATNPNSAQPQLPDLSTLTMDDPPEESVDSLLTQSEARSQATVRASTSIPASAQPIAPEATTGSSETMNSVMDALNAHLNSSIQANNVTQTNVAKVAIPTKPTQSTQPEQAGDNAGLGSWTDFFSEAAKAYYLVQAAQATQAPSEQAYVGSSQVAAGGQDGRQGVATSDTSAGVKPFPMSDLTRSMAREYKYMKTGNGWYEENYYSLRADGTFAFNLGSGMSGEAYNHMGWFSAYDRQKPTGYWKAEGNATQGTFTFLHGDGEVDSRDYWENNQGHFIVNGMRWFRV
ncbi:hypothetical protein GQ53DRAFT_869239 [Thozetella sp. PMI_491]|nr:hypothetical protein GQ53DRAFT_869239 [Thozetella sp. PMI_491]